MERIVGKRGLITSGRCVNSHNCRIWAAEKLHQCLQMPLHVSHIAVWCSFTVTYSLGVIFFEELSAGGPLISPVYVIGAIRDSISSRKAMYFNNSVYGGWCSTTHRPLCKPGALPLFLLRRNHQPSIYNVTYQIV